MPDVLIRAARPTDVSRLVVLLGELFSIEEDFAPDPDRQRAGLDLILAAPHVRVVMVAEAGGQVVGMATGQLVVSTAEGGLSAWLEDVIVQRELRGQGIGRLLILAVEEWAAARGASRLQLLADAGNAAALAFYRRLGWTRTQLICLRQAAT